MEDAFFFVKMFLTFLIFRKCFIYLFILNTHLYCNAIPVDKLSGDRSKIFHTELLPPDHVHGAHLEQDGDVNKDFHHEAFLGKLFNEKKLVWENLNGYKKLIQIFHKVDRNHNHFVNHDELKDWIMDRILEHFEEARSASEEKFALLDHNKDGYLTWGEYKTKLMDEDPLKFISQNLTVDTEPSQDDWVKEIKQWKNADNDHNHKLDKDEFVGFLHPEQNRRIVQVMAEEMLNPLDKNKDGKVSLEEFIALPDGVVDPDEAELDKEYQKERTEEFKRDLDSDGDGFATLDEFRVFLDPRRSQHAITEADYLIGIADRNGDGMLTEEEMLQKYQLFTGSSLTDSVRILHEEF